jgi:hypothetical protein
MLQTPKGASKCKVLMKPSNITEVAHDQNLTLGWWQNVSSILFWIDLSFNPQITKTRTTNGTDAFLHGVSGTVQRIRRLHKSDFNGSIVLILLAADVLQIFQRVKIIITSSGSQVCR